jgi:hypothetical protein
VRVVGGKRNIGPCCGLDGWQPRTVSGPNDGESKKIDDNGRQKDP